MLNGTAEELLFTKHLEAARRRNAWVASLDLQLVATLDAHVVDILNLKPQFLSNLKNLPAGDRYKKSRGARLRGNLQGCRSTVSRPNDGCTRSFSHRDRPHIACLTRPLQIDLGARHLGFIIFRQMLMNMSRFGSVFRTNNQE